MHNSWVLSLLKLAKWPCPSHVTLLDLQNRGLFTLDDLDQRTFEAINIPLCLGLASKKFSNQHAQTSRLSHIE